MSSGLTHIGAIARGLAYAPASAAPVTAVRPERSAPDAAETREKIRDRVMAERGIDALSLFRLPAQDRIRAEAVIMLETAMRDSTRREIHETGVFLDLRV